MAVLGRIEDNTSALECAFELTAGFFFKATLSYVTNLKVDIHVSLMSIEMYDVLVTFGLEDHILKFCEKDHAALRKMLDDAVNFSNVFRLVNATKLISGENIAELDKVLKSIKDNLTLDKIRELKGILANTDPAWTSLKETLGEEAAYASTINEVEEFAETFEEKPEEKPEEAKPDGTSGE